MEDRLREQRLVALIEAGMALASPLELDSLLQKISDLAREVIGAAYAAVGVLDDEGSLSKFIYSGVSEEAAAAIAHLPRGEGVLGVIIEEGKPLRLTEVSEHPRSIGFPDNHPEMHSFLGVPITARGRIFGRLYLSNKVDASEFSEIDERMALTFAAQAGVAIENIHLYQEVRAKTEDLALLEERERIAKELHDGVIQSIYSVGLSLQGASGLLERDSSRAKARIDEAIAELDSVIRDVRNYIFELRPRDVDEKGLIGAITQLARDLEVNTLAHVTLDLNQAAVDTLSFDLQAEVIQITREILSNIARHASASEVTIRCSDASSSVEISIEDNGIGFDATSVTRGLGLGNIEQRTERMKGRFEVVPLKPKGTQHRLSIPIGKRCA